MQWKKTAKGREENGFSNAIVYLKQNRNPAAQEKKSLVMKMLKGEKRSSPYLENS